MDVSFNVENISVIEMNPSSSLLQPVPCVAAKLLVSKKKHLRKQCYSSCLETVSGVVASTCALCWLLPLSRPAAASMWLPLPGWVAGPGCGGTSECPAQGDTAVQVLPFVGFACPIQVLQGSCTGDSICHESQAAEQQWIKLVCRACLRDYLQIKFKQLAFSVN